TSMTSSPRCCPSPSSPPPPPPPPRSTPFPYTPLFRSPRPADRARPDPGTGRCDGIGQDDPGLARPPTPGRDLGHGEHRRRRHPRSEEHTSELQSRFDLVCRLLLEKKKTKKTVNNTHVL